MPTCKECGEEVDEVVAVKVSGKRRVACEECAERLEEESEIAAESEAVIQHMMGYKGRR